MIRRRFQFAETLITLYIKKNNNNKIKLEAGSATALPK